MRLSDIKTADIVMDIESLRKTIYSKLELGDARSLIYNMMLASYEKYPAVKEKLVELGIDPDTVKPGYVCRSMASLKLIDLVESKTNSNGTVDLTALPSSRKCAISRLKRQVTAASCLEKVPQLNFVPNLSFDELLDNYCITPHELVFGGRGRITVSKALSAMIRLALSSEKAMTAFQELGDALAEEYSENCSKPESDLDDISLLRDRVFMCRSLEESIFAHYRVFFENGDAGRGGAPYNWSSQMLLEETKYAESENKYRPALSMLMYYSFVSGQSLDLFIQADPLAKKVNDVFYDASEDPQLQELKKLEDPGILRTISGYLSCEPKRRSEIAGPFLARMLG